MNLFYAHGKMTDAKNLSCCDLAALVALINLLKVNLGSTPEIYNTLLAVLCDFDPSQHDNRERTVRYIRLLLSDKVLANCLLMSLPQGDQFRSTCHVPDMKKAIKHKFTGMRLGTDSQIQVPEEENERTISKSNQNVKIIKDQEEIKEKSVKGNLMQSHSILQILSSDQEKSSLSDQVRETSTSQGQSVTTVAQSSACILSTTSTSQVVLSSPQVSVISVASNPIVVSSQCSTPVRLAVASKSNKPKAIVEGSVNVSRNSVVETSQTSRSQQQNVAVPPKLGHDNSQSTVGPVSIQYPAQSSKTFGPVSQVRGVQSAVLPLPYHQYFNPLQGHMSYSPCLPGPRMSPMLPWSPLQYIPSYLPQNYNFGAIRPYVRHSSVTGSEDSSLDLSNKSTKGNNESDEIKQNNNKTPNFERKGTKRCASETCVSSQNQKQKMRKVSVEIPISSNTKSSVLNKENNSNIQTVEANSLQLVDLSDTNSENQQNSLKALQELTLKINPGSPTVPLTKAGSTGSIVDSKSTPKSVDLLRTPPQRYLKAVSPLPPSSKRWHLIDKTVTTWMKSKTSLPHAVTDTSFVNKDIIVSNKLGGNSAILQQHHVQTKQVSNDSLSHSLSKLMAVTSSSSNVNASSSNVIAATSEKVQAVQSSDFRQNNLFGTRNFPYRQHIQLPDGKCSVLDFPGCYAKTAFGTLNENNNNENCRKSATVTSHDRTNIESTGTEMIKVAGNTDSSVIDSPNLYQKYLNWPGTTCGNLKLQESLGCSEREPRIKQPNSKTCLIIETATENGSTKQVQFKLDQQSSASLLGELLKLKPAHSSLSSVCSQSNASHSVHNSMATNSNPSANPVSQRDISNVSSTPKRNLMVYNEGSDLYTEIEPGCSKSKVETASEADLSFTSLNMSPYLLGMLPDTTTFSDHYDDDDNDDEYDDDADRDEDSFSDDIDDDDDVFLHPIY